MKTLPLHHVEIRDFYNHNQIVRLRVPPEKMEPEHQDQYGFTHCATLTASQLRRLKRELPNGPRGVNVTKQDSRTGTDTEAEVYFNL